MARVESVRRFVRLGACARCGGLLSLVAAAWACAGTLDDPGRFVEDDAGTASLTSTDAAAATDGAGGTCPDVPDLFAHSCTASSCHSASNKAQGLDLASPNLAARLVGVPATEGAGLLIDPTAPSQSVVYAKLEPNPAFGARMPLGAAPLDAPTIACALAWITQQVQAAQGGQSDGGDATDAGTGDAGTGDAGGDDGGAE